jgi:hypothetical protein
VAAQERKARHWVLLAQHYETDQDFRVAVEQALVDIYALSYWGGRGVMTAPIRRKDPETDTYVTIGFAFEEVFMPAVRDPEPERPVEDAYEPPVEERAPEPVGAE